MNILIASAYSKSETDDCLTQYLATLSSYQYHGQVYAPIGNYTEPGTLNVYDRAVEGVEIDEVVLFAPEELSEILYERYRGYPVVDLSSITPRNWEPAWLAKIKNSRSDQLYNYYYAPKGETFQCNPKSLTLMAGRALKITRCQLANLPHPDVHWRTTDNHFCVFTPEEFIEFAESADAYVEQVYGWSWQEIDQINPPVGEEP